MQLSAVSRRAGDTPERIRRGRGERARRAGISKRSAWPHRRLSAQGHGHGYLCRSCGARAAPTVAPAPFSAARDACVPGHEKAPYRSVRGCEIAGRGDSKRLSPALRRNPRVAGSRLRFDLSSALAHQPHEASNAEIQTRIAQPVTRVGEPAVRCVDQHTCGRPVAVVESAEKARNEELRSLFHGPYSRTVRTGGAAARGIGDGPSDRSGTRPGHANRRTGLADRIRHRPSGGGTLPRSGSATARLRASRAGARSCGAHHEHIAIGRAIQRSTRRIIGMLEALTLTVNREVARQDREFRRLW